MLQEWTCQQSVRDVDELRRHLIDSWSIMQQMGIDQIIDQWRLRPKTWVKNRGRQYNIWYNVFLLYCIIGPYVFVLFMAFQLNVWDVNWGCLSLHDITDIRYDTCTYAAFHKALYCQFKRDLWFWWHFVPNLSTYMCNKNYFNIHRFYQVSAKIKLCSFFASQCRLKAQCF